jgi:hypothetical protein
VNTRNVYFIISAGNFEYVLSRNKKYFPHIKRYEGFEKTIMEGYIKMKREGEDQREHRSNMW